MRKSKFWPGAGTTLFCALFFPLIPAPATATPDPHNCGTIIIQPDSDITSFSPIFASSAANARAAQLLYNPLIWINRSGQIDYTRSIAAKIDISADNRIFAITLRPWHWSDGQPVTTADIIAFWNTIPPQGAAYNGYGSGGIPMDIKSIAATDATHIRITLSHPVNPTWFIENGLAQFTPIPSHSWSKFSLDQLYQNQSNPHFFSVVDGPLMIQRLDVGLDAVFTPNPHYDGGKMHFDRFIYKFVESDGAALQQVEAGELDYAPVPLELYKAIKNTRNTHLELFPPVSYTMALNLNYKNPHVAFFKDVRVRDAIQDAMSQRAMIDLIFHGYGTEVYTAVQPAAAAMLAPQLVKGGYPVGYDPARARALLAAAGYVLGPDGIMRKDGRRLEFTDLMASDDGEGEEMTELMQAQLLRVGIKMNIREIEFNQILAVMSNAPGKWDASVMGNMGNGYPSGEGFFETGNNSLGYSDPKMDSLIDASINKPGLDALHDYEIYTAQQQPVVFVAAASHLYLISNRLHGVNAAYDGAMMIPENLFCTDSAGQ